MPLAFNLFGPIRLDLALATRVLRLLFPALSKAKVQTVRFEHSPGRGAPYLSADRTAFDVFITYASPEEKTGFVGIELKYSESMNEPLLELKPRAVRSWDMSRSPNLPAFAAALDCRSNATCTSGRRNRSRLMPRRPERTGG
jgi:hypothetical protein